MLHLFCIMDSLKPPATSRLNAGALQEGPRRLQLPKTVLTKMIAEAIVGPFADRVLTLEATAQSVSPAALLFIEVSPVKHFKFSWNVILTLLGRS